MESNEFPYQNAGNLLPDDFKLCREDFLVFNHAVSEGGNRDGGSRDGEQGGRELAGR